MLFREIPGQAKIKNLLIQTVKNQRVSHAQIFFGPEGSGKLPLAIAYAQYICCENKITYNEGPLIGDSCGTCPSCIKYNKLAHPDLHFFFPVAATKDIKKPVSSEFMHYWRNILNNNNYLINTELWYETIGLENKQGIINAEDCNEIIRILSYKAYESEFKIVIIWMLEKLFHSAAPKLLKILEEPPEKTLFLLISENTDQILNTILSRTQIIKIPRLSDNDIINELQTNNNCNEVVARKIAHLCSGNLLSAVTMAHESTDEEVNFIMLRNWLRLCFKNDIIGTQNFIEEISKTGREKHKSFFNYALRVTRQCILLNLRLDTIVKLEGEEQTFVNNLSPYINPRNGELIAEEFNKAYLHIERNANPRILFLDLSLTMTRLLKIK